MSKLEELESFLVPQDQRTHSDRGDGLCACELCKRSRAIEQLIAVAKAAEQVEYVSRGKLMRPHDFVALSEALEALNLGEGIPKVRPLQTWVWSCPECFQSYILQYTDPSDAMEKGYIRLACPDCAAPAMVEYPE